MYVCNVVYAYNFCVVVSDDIYMYVCMYQYVCTSMYVPVCMCVCTGIYIDYRAVWFWIVFMRVVVRRMGDLDIALDCVCM